MTTPPQGPPPHGSPPPPYGEQQPGQSYGQQPGQPYGGMPPAPSGYGQPPAGGGLNIGSMGQRFLARLLDVIIVGIPAGIIIAVVLGIAASDEAETLEAGGDPSASFWVTYFTTILVVAVLSVLYEVGLIATRGATLGKSIMGLKVLRENDQQIPGWGPSALRWVIPFVGSLVCGVGQLVVYLSPFFDNSGRRQGWHDKVAKTIVFSTR